MRTVPAPGKRTRDKTGDYSVLAPNKCGVKEEPSWGLRLREMLGGLIMGG